MDHFHSSQYPSHASSFQRTLETHKYQPTDEQYSMVKRFIQVKCPMCGLYRNIDQATFKATNPQDLGRTTVRLSRGTYGFPKENDEPIIKHIHDPRYKELVEEELDMASGLCMVCIQQQLDVIKPYLVIQYEKLMDENASLKDKIGELGAVITAKDITIKKYEQELRSATQRRVTPYVETVVMKQDSKDYENLAKAYHQQLSTQTIKMNMLRDRLRSMGVKVSDDGNLLS